jgi:hypothetical protein
MAGYGFLGMLLFFTGLAHGLYAPLIALELLVLGILFRRQLHELFVGIGRLTATSKNSSLSLRFLGGVIAVYLAFLLLISLGPVNAWDAQAFHWTTAKYFARHHAVPFPDFDGNGGTPQLMRMLLSVFCVFHFDHQASHGIWVLFPALLGLVYGVVRGLSRSLVALIITLISFALLIVQPKFVTEPLLDFPILVFGLAAFICALLPCLDDRGDSLALSSGVSSARIFIISGVLTGFAVGIKWQAAALVPVLLIAVVTIWRPVLPAGARSNLLFKWLAAASAPVTIFAIYDLANTGNPFWHPMIPVLWDSNYWANVAPNIYILHKHMDFLLHEMYPSPLYNPVGAMSCYLRTNVLIIPTLILAILSLFACRGRFGTVTRFALGGGFFCILLFSITVGPDSRNMLLGTGMILLAAPVGWDWLMQSRYRKIVYYIPVFIVVGMVYKLSDLQLPIVDQYISRSMRILRGPYYDDAYNKTYFMPAVRWANKHLPSDARIVTDGRLLGNLERDWMTIWPVAQCRVGVSPGMSADSLSQALQHMGTTHLLVDRSALWKTYAIFPDMAEYLAPWGMLLTRDDLLKSVYSDTLTIIYRLQPPGNK